MLKDHFLLTLLNYRQDYKLGTGIPVRAQRVKCLAQGHNKQACRLVLHTIPIVLSTKQGSCGYHFLKSFGMTRLGK